MELLQRVKRLVPNPVARMVLALWAFVGIALTIVGLFTSKNPYELWQDGGWKAMTIRACIWLFLFLLVVTLLLQLPWLQRLQSGAKLKSPMTLLVFFFGGLIAVGLWLITPVNEASAAKVPEVTPFFRMMPHDPPYAEGTVIAGIKFGPGNMDARIRLRIRRSDVRKLDVQLLLINTTGEILPIEQIAQVTSYPGIIIAPVFSGTEAGSVKLFHKDGVNTVPPGATSPIEVKQMTSLWRIYASELIENTTPEFVVMTKRPQSGMIEGFIARIKYAYGSDEEKTITRVAKFDKSGKGYVPDRAEIDRIMKFRPAKVKVSDVAIGIDREIPDDPKEP